MKILLALESGFPVDQNKLIVFLRQNLSHLSFSLFQKDFNIEDLVIVKSETFPKILATLDGEDAKFDRVFCITSKPYNDNYFIHTKKLHSHTKTINWFTGIIFLQQRVVTK